jgi:hypothetical protein
LEEEEDEEKSPRNYHFAMAGVRTLDLCLQSRVLYPLDHGALPCFTMLKKDTRQDLVTYWLIILFRSQGFLKMIWPRSVGWMNDYYNFN